MQQSFFSTIESMELKEIYKKGCRVGTKNFGTVRVENDATQFEAYKKMGLDVFKTDEERALEIADAKAIKDAEKAEEKRLKDRDKAQKEMQVEARKLAKELKAHEKKNNETMKKQK